MVLGVNVDMQQSWFFTCSADSETKEHYEKHSITEPDLAWMIKSNDLLIYLSNLYIYLSNLSNRYISLFKMYCKMQFLSKPL